MCESFVKIMDEWLAIPGIPADGVYNTIMSCPGKIFFLQEDFISGVWELAELPEDKLVETIAFASEVEKDLRLRLLAWHLYRYCNFTPMANFKGGSFPDIIEGVGIKSGLFYLLIALSMIPGFIDRAEREGFPVKYGKAAAKRIGSLPVFFAENHNGAFGLQGRSMTFLLHYRESATWRIGRFDFVIRAVEGALPEIYRRGNEVVAFCPDGALIDGRNNITNSPEKAVRTAEIFRCGSSVRGIPVDLVNGLAMDEEISLDIDENWEKVLGAEDWTIFFHIPGGGRMTPEVCRESFREAMGFFREYFPEKSFKLLWSRSWIFNPAWRDYLPQSNMSKLINSGYLFPADNGDKYPGLYFVFGKKEGSVEEFTAENSLEKAFLQCWQDDNLRTAGFFMFCDDIE